MQATNQLKHLNKKRICLWKR